MKSFLPYTDHFAERHIGPDEGEIAAMLAEVGVGSWGFDGGRLSVGLGRASSASPWGAPPP